MSHLSSYLNYILRMLRIIFFFFLFHFDSYVAFVSSVMIIYTYEKFEFMFQVDFPPKHNKGKIKLEIVIIHPCVFFMWMFTKSTQIFYVSFCVSAYIYGRGTGVIL